MSLICVATWTAICTNVNAEVTPLQSLYSEKHFWLNCLMLPIQTLFWNFVNEILVQEYQKIYFHVSGLIFSSFTPVQWSFPFVKRKRAETRVVYILCLFLSTVTCYVSAYSCFSFSTVFPFRFLGTFSLPFSELFQRFHFALSETSFVHVNLFPNQI